MKRIHIFSIPRIKLYRQIKYIYDLDGIFESSLSVNFHMCGQIDGFAWNRFGFRAKQGTSKQLTLKLDIEAFDDLELKGLHMSLANIQMYIKTENFKLDLFGLNK